MTVGAIVIPLAALALCAVGLALAWRLVRRAEGPADSADAAPVQRGQAAAGDPGADSATPAGAVRVVGQLMALAGVGLGALAVAFALWRAFAMHPLSLAAAAIAICGGMAAWGWRILRRRPRP